MAGEWGQATLDEVSLDVAYGYTESANPERIGPHFLRITDIQQGVVDWSKVPFCKITPENHQKYQLEPGDIVVARTGNSTGENYLFKGQADAVFASYLIRFRIDSSKADPQFVWYNLRSERWRNFIDASKTGSAQAGANAKVLGQFSFPLPSISEQKAIAHILGTLDDKIELNRKMNETLEAMARALFKAWFVDFEPVRAKLEGRWRRGQSLPGMPAHLYDPFPERLVESELGEIPEGWEFEKLGNFVEIHNSCRVPLSSKQRAQRKGPYPYHGAAGIIDSIDDFLFEGIYVLLGEDGSVICTDGRPYTQYVWGKFWVNNHAHVLRGRGISNETLLIFLDQCNIAPFVTGAVQPKLSQGNLKAIPFLNAGQALLKKFGEFAEPLFAQIRDTTEESRTLAQLRDTLLPKLISGKLRVPDAERIVGAAV